MRRLVEAGDKLRNEFMCCVVCHEGQHRRECHDLPFLLSLHEYKRAYRILTHAGDAGYCDLKEGMSIIHIGGRHTRA